MLVCERDRKEGPIMRIIDIYALHIFLWHYCWLYWPNRWNCKTVLKTLQYKIMMLVIKCFHALKTLRTDCYASYKYVQQISTNEQLDQIGFFHVLSVSEKVTWSGVIQASTRDQMYTFSAKLYVPHGLGYSQVQQTVWMICLPELDQKTLSSFHVFWRPPQYDGWTRCP